MKPVKSFLNSVWEVIVSIQTARAAAHLARCGRYQEVRELMLDKSCSR